MMENSRYLAEKMDETGKFEIINKQKTLPLFAVRLKDAAFNDFQLSDKLRQKVGSCPRSIFLRTLRTSL